MATAQKLVRKQFLVSEDNITKIKKIARTKKTSATNVVRLAIEAYDPQSVNDLEAPNLMGLVSDRLKDAIKATKRANKSVTATLKALNTVEG